MYDPDELEEEPAASARSATGCAAGVSGVGIGLAGFWGRGGHLGMHTTPDELEEEQRLRARSAARCAAWGFVLGFLGEGNI